VKHGAIAATALVALAVGGFAIGIVGSEALPIFPEDGAAVPRVAVGEPEKICGGFGIVLSDGECFAAGAIRFVALHNLQGAAQFCKWRAANPGEWARLKIFAGTGDVDNINVVTWLGSSIKNTLEAYLATGAPPFVIQPNTAPNVCKTPLAPPVVGSVTPGETDVTVTIEE
jgi:hypothetical protein